jgi:hemolysin activation/secretion protein
MVPKKLRAIMAISLLQTSLIVRSAEPPEAPVSSPAPAVPLDAVAAKYLSILKYQVEGNTLIRAVDIEQAVMPYLGERRSIKDVEAARQSIEKIYHDRGYQTVLVNIPQQEVSGGVVRLVVVEAPVGQLKIKGSRYHSTQSISAAVPELRSGVVPNFNAVQKELDQLNRTEDLHVTPELRASDTPGQVDVDLNVQDELPLHAMVEVNNRYSANTSQLRLIGEVSYDNLFQRNQSITVQYQTAPEHPDEAKIWSVSYVIPTQGSLVWAVYAVRSDSNIAAVGDLNVIGNGSIYGVKLIDSLPSNGPTFSHNFTAGLDFKDIKEDVTPQGSDTVDLPAKYLPFSLQYTATWVGSADPAHQAAATTAARSSTTLDLGVSFLIHALNVDAEQFVAQRAGAGPSYLIFHPGLQRQQVLPGSWSLAAKVDGQVASGPLITSEQFGTGGVESVRGYTESERLGDDGLRGSLELRTPQLLSGHTRFTSSYFYIFFDGARVRILDPLPTERTGYDLASEGLGFRFKYGGLSTDLDVARADTQGYVTRIGSYSAQFRVNYTW